MILSEASNNYLLNSEQIRFSFQTGIGIIIIVIVIQTKAYAAPPIVTEKSVRSRALHTSPH